MKNDNEKNDDDSLVGPPGDVIGEDGLLHLFELLAFSLSKDGDGSAADALKVVAVAHHVGDCEELVALLKAFVQVKKEGGKPCAVCGQSHYSDIVFGAKLPPEDSGTPPFPA